MPVAEARDRPAGTILLVEDEGGMREVEAFLLRNIGHPVLTADCQQRAELLFEQHQEQIGLLLTDLVLPDGSGLDLHLRCRQANPGLVSLIVSGGELEPCRLPEGADFLRKPFSLAELGSRISSVLGTPRPQSPTCGLSHRLPAVQGDLFGGQTDFICCDTRPCPYKLIVRRRMYCQYPRPVTNQGANQ